MYPFIHIGHFSIGTFGLCLWLASVCACWTLYRNFQRFGIDADAVGVAAYTTVGGVVGAKLWHVLEEPGLLLHHPFTMLFDRAGFAWFGGLLAGIAVLLWQGRQAKTGGLGMLDLAAPAVSVGYGVGRLGCLISGDGDYGIPTSLPLGHEFPQRARSHHPESASDTDLRIVCCIADCRVLMATRRRSLAAACPSASSPENTWC